MKKLKPSKDKIIIADELVGGNDRGPEYLCSLCNITLVRVIDARQNNTTYWCRHCSVEFDPEAENLRKESKILVPDRNQEAAITSIQTDLGRVVEIRDTPEPKGSRPYKRRGSR